MYIKIISTTKIDEIHEPNEKVVFQNGCTIKGDVNALEVMALGSLNVAGSMNVVGDIAVFGGILSVDGDLTSEVGASGINCGLLKVGGNIKTGQGHLRATVVDCLGNVEVAGNILVMFTLKSKKDITSSGSIVAGFQIEAESVRPGKGHKVFAGVTAGDREDNSCLQEIKAKEVHGPIGHGTFKNIHPS